MTSAQSAAVRPSAIAGAWYPGSAPALRRAIEGYLAQVEPVSLPGPALALVSPHAGYAYSGPTAAHAYAQVRGQDFRRVVLLGPLHRPIRGHRLGAFMAPSESAYRTPLGDVPVDHAFIEELSRHVPLTVVSGDQEHSLEIELPFLQVALPAFSLAPIMVGEHLADPGAEGRAEACGAALAALWDEHTLFVASTDLSHLYNYDDVVATDARLVALLNAFDVDGLSAALRAGEAQACGAAGLITVLKAAQRLRARGARALHYAASGDITGDRQPGTYTVGYLAAAVYR